MVQNEPTDKGKHCMMGSKIDDSERILLVFFYLLAIVLSDLRFTASDYRCGFFKLFIQMLEAKY